MASPWAFRASDICQHPAHDLLDEGDRSRLDEVVVGAAAEEKRGLADLRELGDKVNAATGTMGVALTSCIVPAAGTPTFDIGEGEMELGVGIHGEPGRERVALPQADAIASTIVTRRRF